MGKDSNQGRIVRFATIDFCGFSLSTDCNTDPLVEHRVDRLPGFFSSRPNRDPPPPKPLTRRQVCAPLLFRGGTHSLAGEGVSEGPNSDEATDTVVL
jgi:hypothetical protein